jgi:hypothetical protein
MGVIEFRSFLNKDLAEGILVLTLPFTANKTNFIVLYKWVFTQIKTFF